MVHGVGRQAVRWLRERWEAEKLQLIGTRNYVATLTLLYANWLFFPDDAIANEFLNVFPQFMFLNRWEQVEQMRSELTAKMEQRLARGGFDLSKHPVAQRRAIADHFSEMDHQVEHFNERLADLKLAESLREDWTRSMEMQRLC